VAQMTGFPAMLHMAISFVLGSEHLGGRDLDAEIATGHHNTIRLLEDLGEVVEALAVFDLGNDLDPGPLRAQDRPDIPDVLRAADEGGKDHVDIVLDTKTQVVLVLLGQGRQIHIGVGQVDALLGRDEAVVAGTHLDGLGVRDFEDVEGQNTVVDIDDPAGLDHLGDVLVVDVHVLGVATGGIVLVRREVHDGAGGEGNVLVILGVARSDQGPWCRERWPPGGRAWPSRPRGHCR